MNQSKPVSSWTLEEKLNAALRRAIPLLPGETGRQLEAMLTPEALGVMAGMMVLWGGSHFVGIGEIIDILLVSIGIAAFGLVALEAIDEILDFIELSFKAASEAQLDRAAAHLARAISLLGIQAVMAILVRKTPKRYQKANFKIRSSPPIRGKIRYKPQITYNAHLPRRGNKIPVGRTNEWGDIYISWRVSGKNLKITEIHERVHSALTPKLYFLRNTRVRIRMNAYNKSALLRYLEEALAETIAEVSVLGIHRMLKGITFPVRNGYVTLAGMQAEAASILLGPINIGGMMYNVYYGAAKPRHPEVP